jgi:hypothetical protein|tara:strand:+ start:1006 stop:1182 length:177 start_codon:yes stop_codon:yes gene_type:complete
MNRDPDIIIKNPDGSGYNWSAYARRAGILDENNNYINDEKDVEKTKQEELIFKKEIKQ